MNAVNVAEFDNLRTYFYTDAGTVKAVDGVSFSIPAGKTVGVVGESGCGKSVTGLSLMGLIPKPQGKIISGTIRLNINGETVDITQLSAEKMNRIRGKMVSMIFQEPMTSLNPVFKIGHQIEELLAWHQMGIKKAERKTRVSELLSQVGLSTDIASKFPYECSGGMCQRVMIAIALACDPALIIADEPTTALDVTIQAQILALLKQMTNKINASVMLITHDLGVIADMADIVVVMYAGRVVEKGTVKEVLANPAHPYTIGLIDSRPTGTSKRLYSIPGTVPSPINMPKHCYFLERCKNRAAVCSRTYPDETQISDTHSVTCYKYG